MNDASLQNDRSVVRSIVVVVALIGGGSGIAGLLYAKRVEPPRDPTGALPPLVEAMVVRAEDVTESFVGFGTAQADHVANLAAELPSRVVERVGDIKPGSAVQKGQPLVRLDDRQYRHELNRAQELVTVDRAALREIAVEAANLEQIISTVHRELRVVQAEKARLTDLMERSLAAEKEFNVADLAYQQVRRVLQEYERAAASIAPRRARLEALMRSHEAAAALAQLNVERCVIGAPFDGSIQALFVDVGDRVAAGSVVLTLIDASHVEVPIQLPASVYDRIEIGAACRLESEALHSMTWQGVVARVAPFVDPLTRTFAAYIRVDNLGPGPRLVPGSFVRADVAGQTFPGRLLIPRGAIRGGHVFVAEGNVAHRRAVQVERHILDRALVAGDLRAGDRLILTHLHDLSDRAPVRIHEPHVVLQSAP